MIHKQVPNYGLESYNGEFHKNFKWPMRNRIGIISNLCQMVQGGTTSYWFLVNHPQLPPVLVLLCLVL